MCKIIDRINAGEVTEDNIGEVLEEIAAKLEAGVKPGKYKEALDKLLNTEMEPRNRLAEAHWEEAYRNQEFEDV